MKYWHVYYDKDKKQYQLTNREDTLFLTGSGVIAVFINFDMAYQYVTRMNSTNDVQAYSKWTVNR